MVVVKLGGNAAWPRHAGSIDESFVNEVFRYLAERFERSREKLILLPGGIGGQVFIEWARHVGSSNAFINEVGCKLIGISGSILIQVATNLMGSVVRVCPALATSLEELDRFVQAHDCVVAAVPVKGALTSDSVGALVAEHFHSPLVLVKNHRPFVGTECSDCYVPGDTYHIDLDRAIHCVSSTFATATAGHYPSLDLLCLTILKRSGVPACVITRDALLTRLDGAEPTAISIAKAPCAG